MAAIKEFPPPTERHYEQQPSQEALQSDAATREMYTRYLSMYRPSFNMISTCSFLLQYRRILYFSSITLGQYDGFGNLFWGAQHFFLVCISASFHLSRSTQRVIIALHWSFIANMATVMLLCYIGVNFVLPRFAVAENATNEGDFALAINTMQRIHGICRTVVCRVVEAKGDSPSRFHMIIIVSLVVLALFGQLFSHPPIIWTICTCIR